MAQAKICLSVGVMDSSISFIFCTIFSVPVIERKRIFLVLMSEYIIQIRNSKQKLENLIFSVTNWLIRIAKSKKEDNKNNKLSLTGLTREALLGYQRAQHLSEYEKNIIQGFCSNIREKEFINPVLQHGDFSPINIIYNRNNNAFFVLDWGYANSKGVPLVDLFGFFLMFSKNSLYFFIHWFIGINFLHLNAK